MRWKRTKRLLNLSKDSKDFFNYFSVDYYPVGKSQTKKGRRKVSPEKPTTRQQGPTTLQNYPSFKWEKRGRSRSDFAMRSKKSFKAEIVKFKALFESKPKNLLQ